MLWLALTVLESLSLASVCYAELGPSGGERWTHDTCTCIHFFFVLMMDPGAFCGPSRNTNLHYGDPNNCVTLTCKQAIVFDICESLLPTWAYCPLSDEVY